VKELKSELIELSLFTGKISKIHKVWEKLNRNPENLVNFNPGKLLPCENIISQGQRFTNNYSFEICTHSNFKTLDYTNVFNL